ncbi:MAG: hypothetical protein ACPGXK_05900, partial [Phycisphaerae bacterium]
MANENDLPQMIDIGEAHEIVCRVAAGIGDQPDRIESVALEDANGRTLAKAIRTDICFPPFSRSVMDGFAVRAEDTQPAPQALRILGRIPAGGTFAENISQGTAVRINTGAPIPSGATAVVRIEDCDVDDHEATVTVRKSVDVGTFISDRAAFAEVDDVVVPAGTRMGALELAAAASAGAARV